MEVIGTYDPIPKEPREGESNRWKDIRLDISRAKYWLGVGAQPSDPAWRLLAMVRIVLRLKARLPTRFMVVFMSEIANSRLSWPWEYESHLFTFSNSRVTVTY